MILERDGAYPPMPALLGRAAPAAVEETARAPEAFLAALYLEPARRERFLADPLATARAAGLGERAASIAARSDRAGIEMAARSFARKRGARAGSPPSWFARLRERASRWIGPACG